MPFVVICRACSAAYSPALFVLNPQNPVPTATLSPWSCNLVRSTPLVLAYLGPTELCVGRRGLCVSLRLRPGRIASPYRAAGAAPRWSTSRYPRRKLRRGFVRGGYTSLFFQSRTAQSVSFSRQRRSCEKIDCGGRFNEVSTHHEHMLDPIFDTPG